MLDVAKYLAELEAEKATVESENIDEIVDAEIAKIREQVREQVVNHHQGKLVMIDVRIDTVKKIMEG
jgi:transcriptional regulator NrdR family protein